MDRRALLLTGAVAFGAACYYFTRPVKPRNAAFVFVKPHAMTQKTIELVRMRLAEKGFEITSEGSLTAEVIDERRLIDQHYYAIAAKAKILQPKELNVPKDTFKSFFGMEWEDALSEGLCLNALQACKEFGCTASELNKAWVECKNANRVAKLGGGFYCGHIRLRGKKRYVLNGFYMSMRSAYTEPGNGIHYYTVEWNPEQTSWEDFRAKVFGATDPKEAPKDSLRGEILSRWKELGLAGEPTMAENSVHASASPFEGVTERMNWLGMRCNQDAFCRALVRGGIKEATIHEWSFDPQVKIDQAGRVGSLFDAMEDLDAQECIDKAKALQDLQ